VPLEAGVNLSEKQDVGWSKTQSSVLLTALDKKSRSAVNHRTAALGIRIGVSAYFLSQVTTTYLDASSPSDLIACSLVTSAEEEVTVTFWVPGLSPAAISTLETPANFVNASRTCTLQPPQVTPVMPAT
jgi:hypothetical protein